MTAASTLDAPGAPSARPGRRFTWAWLGVMPFLIFAFAFLVLPTIYLLAGSFQNLAAAPTDPAHGAFTLENYRRAVHRRTLPSRTSRASRSAR